MNSIRTFYNEMATYLGSELVLLLGAITLALLLLIKYRRVSSRVVNVLVFALNVLLVPNAFILSLSIALAN